MLKSSKNHPTVNAKKKIVGKTMRIMMMKKMNTMKKMTKMKMSTGMKRMMKRNIELGIHSPFLF